VPDFPRNGILFYDITTVLKDGEAFRAAVDLMSANFQQSSIDLVVAMESRGFIFGAPLAYLLGAGFVPIRKLGSCRRRKSRAPIPWSTPPTPSKCIATRLNPANECCW
jgi:adenine phosphoribosyltransferase